MTETDLHAPDPAPVAPDDTTGPAATVPDAALASAVGAARAAAVAVGGDAVGELRGVHGEGELIVTHAFDSALPGYRGWYWAVSLTRADGSEHVTVDEVVQLPGDDALLAPPWLPWDQRVRPGDLSPGDLLPTTEDDIRLVPGYTLTDDETVRAVAYELGVGRERVLSRDGRLMAAERWFEGDHGPDTPMARQAPAHCGTCGFFVALAGSLAAGFGVCANEVTGTDGQVVSVEYGCGAHSQTEADRPSPVEVAEIAYDDGDEIVANPTGATGDEADVAVAVAAEPEPSPAG